MTEERDIVERLLAHRTIVFTPNPRDLHRPDQATIPDALCQEAAAEIARLRAEIERKDAALRIFLGEDDRFEVAVGGNPLAVDKMLTNARAVLTARPIPSTTW